MLPILSNSVLNSEVLRKLIWRKSTIGGWWDLRYVLCITEDTIMYILRLTSYYLNKLTFLSDKTKNWNRQEACRF